MPSVRSEHGSPCLCTTQVGEVPSSSPSNTSFSRWTCILVVHDDLRGRPKREACYVALARTAGTVDIDGLRLVHDVLQLLVDVELAKAYRTRDTTMLGRLWAVPSCSGLSCSYLTAADANLESPFRMLL